MSVVARTRFRDLVLSGHGTLMAQCLAAGLPVASSCAGRGACARCVVHVAQGLECLSAPDPHEALVLVRERAADDVRLSCQTRVVDHRGDVVIQTGYW